MQFREFNSGGVSYQNSYSLEGYKEPLHRRHSSVGVTHLIRQQQQRQRRAARRTKKHAQQVRFDRTPHHLLLRSARTASRASAKDTPLYLPCTWHHTATSPATLTEVGQARLGVALVRSTSLLRNRFPLFCIERRERVQLFRSWTGSARVCLDRSPIYLVRSTVLERVSFFCV